MFTYTELHSLVKVRVQETHPNKITKALNRAKFMDALDNGQILTIREIVILTGISNGKVLQWLHDNSCRRHGVNTKTKCSLN